jgi:outer membrane protein assembly factor BamB
VLEENGLSNLTWGTSSSPLIVDGLTVITGGRGSGAVLYAYRSSDGTPAWKSGDGDASYASPVLASLAGRRVILSNNATSLTAHDPATGRILFNHAWGGSKWPKASQPVVIGADRVFLSAGYGMDSRRSSRLGNRCFVFLRQDAGRRHYRSVDIR